MLCWVNCFNLVCCSLYGGVKRRDASFQWHKKKVNETPEVVTWDSIYKMGVGFLNLHPWELKEYTLRELVYRMDEKTKCNQEEVELIQKTSQLEWERARWISANIMNSMGAKLTSVFSLTVFPWESPPPQPTEDILSKFPKTLN